MAFCLVTWVVSCIYGFGKGKNMNKIDAFFIMFSGLLVWVFCILLVPATVMMFVYAGISAWTVGTFIGSLPTRIAKQTEKYQNGELHQLINSQLELSSEMLAELRIRGAIIRGQQATIDQLMFEYCPEEMTAEQIANYEAHVRAATSEEKDKINRELH